MHFVEGKKTYANNIPTIFTSKSKPRKSPTVRVTVNNNIQHTITSGETSKAIGDDADTSTSVASNEIDLTVAEPTVNAESEDPINKPKEEIAILESEKMKLQNSMKKI